MKNIHLFKQGFTLIELAMVLFIVGLLLGGLLVPYATSVERRDREESTKQLQDYQETLNGYAMVNGRLPCPDCKDNSGGCAAVTANDGLEDQTGTSPNKVCASLVGNIPWVTLNGRQFDAWGRAVTYRVTQNFALEALNTTATAPCVNSTLTAFDLCTPGDIQVYSSDAATGAATGDVAQDVPAIVVAHGKNHYENAQSNDEVENFDRNPTIFSSATNILASYSGDVSKKFVYKNYTSSDGSITYDDLMIWISPFPLKNRMITAGKLP